MKKTALVAYATAVMLAGGVSLSAAQDPAPAPAPHTPTPQATAPQTPADRAADRADDANAKTLTGELVKVDVDAKTIAIKDASGTEQTFSYTDATDVSDSQTGVSGLATKAGAKVKVHYSGEGSTRVATKIEMDDDKDKK
jgi:hypothetical protein